MLAENGTSQAAIVLAEDPTKAAQLAAAELQHYLKKITGAELPMITKSDISKYQYLVLVGESERTQSYGLHNEDFQKQEYLIQTRDNVLILMGHDDPEKGEFFYDDLLANGSPGIVNDYKAEDHLIYRAFGSVYAVHTFLEDYCGVRWYLPGDIGEVAPPKDVLAVSSSPRREKPWTKYRRSSRMFYRKPFNFYSPSRPYKTPQITDTQTIRDRVLWQLRMKIGGDVKVFNHGFYRVVYVALVPDPSI